MRVLHTADWHLGQRFISGHERTDEHRFFLEWLVQTVRQQNVEVLVLAGDVFDTGSPSNAALELYYSFLMNMRGTSCRDIVIVGGNHDSPATLNAPARLLRHLRVHVVGCVPDCFEDQVIILNDAQDQPGLVVCAVPFLRDRDVRLSVPGESAEEREIRIRQGIADHYARFTELVAAHKAAGLPVLATGHLYAAGGAASDSERTIHVGNLGQVSAEHFPEVFDYVALGHLHRPQRVGGREHIRYSGSPIPLSFSEVDHPKQVVLLDITPGSLSLETLEVPGARRLIRWHGSLEEVLNHLTTYDNTGYQLPAWIDVEVRSELTQLEVAEQLLKVIDLLDRTQLEVLARRHFRIVTLRPLDEPEPLTRGLDDFTEREVFERRLDDEPQESRTELLSTFDELLELMREE
ncbi:exonuclease SbcCD subunit D C-terminal domain-containing protein [Hymenobacter sp. BT491]|uniref:exonuclease SbcCD subunit D C-terminal domain-containing protein n=1 Tax=Hymenobacter sp. BT491 TaxID=2766779 RepID=UPI00165382FF|nr:exonuclease SbcCD subunit D C-terminal domain-containing protein [Hymenobacter sp. BT491]MBC6988519.1 exonuclease SbcCD subunit D C-terminal domain-containing protein [Hymenobacter sp. BT491]